LIGQITLAHANTFYYDAIATTRQPHMNVSEYALSHATPADIGDYEFFADALDYIRHAPDREPPRHYNIDAPHELA